ncbi:multicopper oxidase domain-containing protein [Kitasatospora sp. NPDC052896]|uniref:multicopper oxidase domain-containing protein n=1 Tax=Kitasatospora sp. NPDC052896 TaxID=3364061 RepID=UPI0037C63C34
MTGPSRRELLWRSSALLTGVAVGGIAAVPAAAVERRSRSTVRTYHLAADQVTWNYAPQGGNLITGAPFAGDERDFTVPGPARLGAVHQKSRYRQYTDDSFGTLVRPAAEDAHLGLLGPVLRAAVGDTVRVVFRNNTPFPASIHPHGVFCTRADEGATGSDGTTPSGPTGDVVAPGDTFTYTWEVPERAGPGPNDPSSIAWLYHDHSVTTGVPGTEAGLVGALVVTRRADATPDARPADVDQELFALFTEFDETGSPYFEQNLARYAPGQTVDTGDPAFRQSCRKASINGYLFGNGPHGTTATEPGLRLVRGRLARWHVFGFGGAGDQHTPHWHGNTVTVAGRRTDVVTVLPASMITADMRPDNPGIWQLHCHVDEHMLGGMATRYQVREATG